MKNRFRAQVVFPFLAIMSMIILSRCEDPAIVSPEQDAVVIGSIHGVVTNATTGVRLSGASVTWAGGDTSLTVQSTITDSAGFYVINGLNPGVYTINYAGLVGFTEHNDTAYISTVQEVVAFSDEDAKGVYYVSETQNASLYELTAGIKGVIWAPLENGTFSPASGADLLFDVANSTIAPNIYRTTSGEDGSFLLTGLPAGASGSLYVLPYSKDNVSYATMNVINVALHSGEERDMGDISLVLATGTPFLVNTSFENQLDVTIDASLTGTFSKSINAASFFATINDYDPGSGGLAVSWMNNITFTITPSSPFTIETFYTVTLSGMSDDGNSFNFTTSSFRTEAGIALVATNLWVDENMTGVDDFPVDSALTLTFSRQVDLANIKTDITFNDASNTAVEVAKSLSSNGRVLTLTPSASLAAGSNYSVSGDVASTLQNDDVFVFVAFTTAQTAITAPAQVISAEHDTTYENWPVDYNSTDFRFEWTGVVGATGYRIYAKDTHNNRNNVHVGTLTIADNQVPEARYSQSFSLPSLFDYFADDGIQTPFLHGTQVIFTIKAYNVAGEGPASAEMILSDRLSPNQTLSGQSGTANNAGGVIPLEVTLTLSSGEYLDRAGTSAVVEGYSVSTVMEWNNTNTGGTLRITIPPDSTKVGYNVIINLEDTSGNRSATALILN